MNHEHELSSEALERILSRLDAYKSNEMKRCQETSRRIEIKKMLNELTCYNEGSSSTMDNTSGAYNDCANEVTEKISLFKTILISKLLFSDFVVLI